MIDFYDILSNPGTRSVILSIGSLCFSTFLKVISRKDGFVKITRNDVAVGFNLMAMSLIVLFNKAFEYTASLNNNIGAFNLWITIIIEIIGIFLFSVFVRSFGWKSEKELKIWTGIIIPALAGTAALIYSIKQTLTS